MQCMIPCHRVGAVFVATAPLCFFNKFISTFRTGDFYLTLPFWNTDFLCAGRTFKKLKDFCLFSLLSPPVKVLKYRMHQLQKFCIFPGSFTMVMREHPENTNQ